LPSAASASLKREAASSPAGISLVLKKPRLVSQTFTPLGRAIEADRRASPTTQVYLYEEIAAEGLLSAEMFNKQHNLYCRYTGFPATWKGRENHRILLMVRENFVYHLCFSAVAI